MATYKGRFKPQHPEKYKGDPTNIIYRSRWELKFMMFLDSHPEVKQWQSEEIFIRYRDPTTNVIRRYFPDFLIKTDKGTTLIEVKPERETMPSKAPRNTKRFLRETMVYAKNLAKWKAAEEYAKDRGWTFQVFTEHHLGVANG